MDDQELEHIFYEKENGHQILKCIQCGTCSGSCPLTGEMDHAPRELFALIRDGGIREALGSTTPWYCVSCYQCMVRCPQQIPVADLMYALKRLALSAGLACSGHKMPDMYKAFDQVTRRFGRITEPVVMARYGLGHPGDVLANLPTAIRMLGRGRIGLLPQRTREPKKIRALLASRNQEE
ncbi:MAG: 4Fe-4S dicluster domain-containing protein [Proteobacteria bacterium]|nr:4Fe-4S dicluster domain-containing protein [Pseudomonadota bacterium]